MTDYDDLARLALEAAHDSLFIRWHDDVIGTTTAPVLAAEIGSDALSESNLAAATTLLADHIATGDVTEDTVGRSGRTWLRMLTVRVYDDAGNLTQAWRDFVDRVYTPLQDYAILDESDYQQREYDNYVEQIDFTFGAAGGAVRDALAVWGIFRLDDIDANGIIRAVDEFVQGGYPLSDEEASGLAWTVNQFRKRNPDEALPALDRLVAVDA